MRDRIKNRGWKFRVMHQVVILCARSCKMCSCKVLCREVRRVVKVKRRRKWVGEKRVTWDKLEIFTINGQYLFLLAAILCFAHGHISKKKRKKSTGVKRGKVFN